MAQACRCRYERLSAQLPYLVPRLLILLWERRLGAMRPVIKR